MREARDQTVPGAAGARGSDDFCASGMVHRSPSTCAGSSSQTAYSAYSPTPMQCVDGAANSSVLSSPGAVREQRNPTPGVAGLDESNAQANTGDGNLQGVLVGGGEAWASQQAVQPWRMGLRDPGGKVASWLGSSASSPLPGSGAERPNVESHIERDGESDGVTSSLQGP